MALLAKRQHLTDQDFIAELELSDLHCHLGFAADYQTLWEIAHRRGLNLSVKNFWEFKHLISVKDNLTPDLRGNYLKLNLYDITERIQSDPEAIKECVIAAISKGYRESNLTLFEIRFNPILRSLGGKLSLDHLILAALQGVDKARLLYPVSAGIILSMDRRFTHQQNSMIVKKAIEYQKKGVIGIDLAGPNHTEQLGQNWKPQDIVGLVQLAKHHGLGVTIHTGDITDAKEVWEVVQLLKPDRIGHGIYAVYDPFLLELIAKQGIVLETCPNFYYNNQLSERFGSLNLIKDMGGLDRVYQLLNKYGVKYTINTDGPEMQDTSIREIMVSLLTNKILTREDIIRSLAVAKESTFIKD